MSEETARATLEALVRKATAVGTDGEPRFDPRALTARERRHLRRAAAEAKMGPADWRILGRPGQRPQTASLGPFGRRRRL